jgi:autotransporter-associated beta strand protein
VGNLALQGFSQPGQVATLYDLGGEIDLYVTTLDNANLTWAGDGVNNVWDLENTANFLNGASPSAFYNGDKVTFNDAGSTSPAVSLYTALSPGAVTVNASANYTFAGAGKITGTNALTKSGSGSLTLLTLNDYSGGTTINAGTVQVGNGATTGDIGTGNIANNGALIFAQTDARSVAGVLSGSGSLTQQGSSTLTLQQNNTYSGTTTISSGTLQIGNGGATGTVGTNTITDNGALAFNTATGFNFNQTVTGSGEVDFNGVANVNYVGAKNYQGNTYINHGVVKLTGNDLIPDAASVSGSTGWLIVNAGTTNGGVFDLNGFNETVNVLAGTGGTVPGVVTNSSAATTTNTLTIGNDFNSDPTATFAGQVMENSSGAKITIVKQGGSSNILSGASSYSGNTIVKAGTLTLGNGLAAGTGSVTLSNGATLNLILSGGNSIFVNNTIITGPGATVTNTSNGRGNSFSGSVTSADANGTNVFAGAHSISSASTKQFQSHNGTVQVLSEFRFSSTTLTVNGGDNTTFDIESTGTIETRNGVNAGAGVSLGALTGNGTLKGASDAAGNSTYVIGAKDVDSTFSGRITDTTFGNVSIVKMGSAKLTLSGSVTNTGSTTVSNGVLALSGSASLDNSGTIKLGASTASIDVTDIGGTLNLGILKAQTLSGFGTVTGGLNEGASSTVSAGLGMLNVTGSATLNGNITLQVNRTNAPTHSEIAATSFTIGGPLTVNNAGSALQSGDTFQLFNHAVTGFTATNLPALGTGLYWTNNLALNGSIAVASSVNTNPTNITFTVSGSTLTLSWPSDHTGWTLQAQTNSLATGLNTNASAWFDVPGSATINSTNITIDPTKPTVFYRLKY